MYESVEAGACMDGMYGRDGIDVRAQRRDAPMLVLALLQLLWV